jgi:hypothetical protein
MGNIVGRAAAGMSSSLVEMADAQHFPHMPTHSGAAAA